MMDEMPNISDLFKYANQLKDQFQKAQEQLAENRFEASSGGGMVVATVNGRGELVDIKISPEVIDPKDPEMLEDMIKAAVAAAGEKARKAMPMDASSLGSMLDMEGLKDLFGGG